MVIIHKKFLIKNIIIYYPSSVFPVSVSGVFQLPVTAQMYHSLVQQQMPGSDTVCVTPMQVQNLIANSNLCGSLVNNSPTTTTFQIMTSTSNHSQRNLINNNSYISHSNNNAIAHYSKKNSANAPVVRKHILKKKIFNVTAVSDLKLKTKKVSPLKGLKATNNDNNNSKCVKNKNDQKISKCVKSLKLMPKVEESKVLSSEVGASNQKK
jgi:hypothetical protein